ncbi:hypothetical protein MBLNU457_5467t1 [Dothideomycetes sp. NU457]
MRFLTTLAYVTAAAFLGRTLAIPVNVSPGGSGALTVTANNTLNATNPSTTANAPITSGLQLELINNLAGQGAVNCYVTGLDHNNQLVMLQPNGQFYYPSASGDSTPQQITADVAIPLGAEGSTTTVTIPSYISAARIWFAQGELQFFTVQGESGPSLVEPSAVNPSDPSADVNWGFVELTWTEAGGVFANVSYVDFVGLVLGMSLTCSDNSVQEALGLQTSAVASICNDLAAQAAIDGQPWDDLCVTGTTGQPLRVLNPTDYLALSPTAFHSYWDACISAVWTHYSTTTLTIDTQSTCGSVSCSVSGDTLTCAGDNRAYARPTASDIFGCNTGPFAILDTDNDVHRAVVPRLCAAFDRSTFLVPGGDVQPSVGSQMYYSDPVTNWYAKIVHRYEVDTRGYAFAYDDVTPTGAASAAGVVAAGDATLLTITVGGGIVGYA